MADNAHELAGVERQVEVVDGGAATGVGKLDMVKGEHRLGVFRMRAQRRRVRGACGRLDIACRTVGVDDFRDQAFCLVDIQTGCAAYQAIGLKAVKDARDARAIDTDAAKLVGMRKNLVRLALQCDLAVIEHQHTVAVLRKQSDLLLNDDDGDAEHTVCLAQRLEDQGGTGGIERCGWLIEH